MVFLKTAGEIKIMREGGRKLALVLKELKKIIKPGVKTGEIDKQAEELIKKEGGKPSFKMVPGYFWSTCITVNDEVVHGIPGERELKEGDIVGIDMGMYYRGFHADMAETLKVQSGGEDEFLTVGKKALKEAIKMAKPGNYLGQISKAIQKEIEKAGFSPVRALTGHGIGRKLHEEPSIPCFLDKKEKETPKLEKGMVLAIEVIYNQGGPEVVLAPDGWTIKTKDGKISALFEETIAVDADGSLLLTE